MNRIHLFIFFSFFSYVSVIDRHVCNANCFFLYQLAKVFVPGRPIRVENNDPNGGINRELQESGGFPPRWLRQIRDQNYLNNQKTN